MQEDKGILQAFAKAMGLVTDAVGFIIGSLLVGYFLDKFFVKTKPWITVGMVAFGMIMGFSRLIKRYQNEEEKENERKS